MESVRAASDHDRAGGPSWPKLLAATIGAQRGGALLVEPALPEPDGTDRADRLAALLRRPDALVLVGTLDDVVVAFAGRTVEEDGRGVRRGRLAACFVEEGARGVGVGRLLLDRSLAWMAEQGLCGRGRHRPPR